MTGTDNRQRPIVDGFSHTWKQVHFNPSAYDTFYLNEDKSVVTAAQFCVVMGKFIFVRQLQPGDSVTFREVV